MSGPVERARVALRSGAGPVEVSAELAAETPDPRGAALAACEALSTGRLPDAYAALVRPPVRERGDPVRYRATPGMAGEPLAARLPPGDEEAAGRVRQAREHRAREAAATAR
ncbi:hypothetical protein AB0D46_04000 [Streptomyces sp. NPDC048383]|uniref:hypothetical protein n=1 Tax=Streptomyces sp. NPDC048383 TaxID=3155386 RepID=UPI00343AF8E1